MCSVEKYSSNVKYAKKSWIIAKLEIQRLKKHTLFLPLLYRVVIDKVLVFLKGYRCVYCIVWKNNLLTSNTLKNGWIITKLKNQRFKKHPVLTTVDINKVHICMSKNALICRVENVLLTSYTQMVEL